MWIYTKCGKVVEEHTLWQYIKAYYLMNDFRVWVANCISGGTINNMVFAFQVLLLDWFLNYETMWGWGRNQCWGNLTFSFDRPNNSDATNVKVLCVFEEKSPKMIGLCFTWIWYFTLTILLRLFLLKLEPWFV